MKEYSMKDVQELYTNNGFISIKIDIKEEEKLTILRGIVRTLSPRPDPDLNLILFRSSETCIKNVVTIIGVKGYRTPVDPLEGCINLTSIFPTPLEQEELLGRGTLPTSVNTDVLVLTSSHLEKYVEIEKVNLNSFSNYRSLVLKSGVVIYRDKGNSKLLKSRY